MIPSTSCELRPPVLAASVLLAIVQLFAQPARAEPTDNEPDPAAAALFREGRELVGEGHWKEGCAKFEASLKRYGSASTALNLARCREHDGKLASAWALYKRGRVLNRDTPSARHRAALERIASDSIARLEPRLPRLRVLIDNPPANLVVRQDGLELPPGSALPLDPGRHVLVASAPGHATVHRSVDLVEGKTKVVHLELTPLHEQESRPLPRSHEGAKERREPAPRPAPLQGGPPTWTWVVGGVGIALGATAVGFALDARATADTLEAKCGADLVCNEDLSFDPAPENARKNRDVGLAIGLGSAGVIALGAAIFGIASTHRSDARIAASPWVSAGSGGLGLSGQF